MRAVVVGGSGFLGSHVADALSDAGHEVVIFDARPSRWARPDQTVVIGDLLDEAKVDEVVAGADVVYNFGGIADIEEARERPIDTVRYNVLGNVILAEAACRHHVRRFLFASSVYVYSQSGSFYRCSKQASELFIESYQATRGLDFTVLRYGSCTVPGPTPATASTGSSAAGSWTARSSTAATVRRFGSSSTCGTRLG